MMDNSVNNLEHLPDEPNEKPPVVVVGCVLAAARFVLNMDPGCVVGTFEAPNEKPLPPPKLKPEDMMNLKVYHKA